MKERSGMPYDVVAFENDELALALTPEEEGIFHRMMRKAWVNGSVPADMTELAHLCRVNPRTMRKAWVALRPMWTPKPGNPTRIISKKMERERKFLEAKRNAARNSANARWNANKHRVESDANALQSSNAFPSHPIPSQPVPVPIDPSNLKIPSVRIQPNGNGHRGRTNGKEQDFQKFWGPVEGYLRQQVVDDAFQTYYAGCRIVQMKSKHVLLAVPGALIERYGNADTAASILTDAIQKSQTGLLRDRKLKVISVEQLVEEGLT